MRALYGLSTHKTSLPAGRTLAFITASQIDLVYRGSAEPAAPAVDPEIAAQLRLLRHMDRVRKAGQK